MKDQNTAVMLLIASSFFFALMALFVKSAGSYPLYQMVFFRGLVAVTFYGIYSKYKGIKLKSNNLKFNLLRASLGTLGVFLYYFTIRNMNLANAVMLNKLSPFFVIIFSFVFLKENIYKYQIFSIFIALFGASLVIKPVGAFEILPSLTGLLSATFAGVAYVVVRYLRDYDTPESIVFHFGLVNLIVSIPLMIIYGFSMPPLYDLIPLLSIGVTAMTAQILMTYAYKHASASKISIYSYGNIIFSIFFSAMFFNDFPNLLSILGATLIISAAYLNYYKNNKKDFN
ncbi:MAG: DMT family transporter [Clostridiales bacterium]|nr:DMT family transporter [Clostridiales bacterium]